MDTQKAITFIYNPIAGNGAALQALPLVRERLGKTGYVWECVSTEYPGHATELAKKAAAAGAAVVCAMGGDGTVREVALGLAGTDTALGILPCGTGNDYIKALHIPSGVCAALEVVLDGRILQANYALANGLPFINVAGFGFDVDVLDRVDIYKKNTKNGRIAYLKGLFSSIRSRSLRNITYRLDGGAPVQSRALIVSAALGTHIGGGICIAPKAIPNDDLLDFTIVHDVVSLKDVLTVLPALLSGKILEKKQYVTSLRGRSLSAECEPASRIQIDGERLPGTPVTFEITDAHIAVLVSPDCPHLSYEKEKN